MRDTTAGKSVRQMRTRKGKPSPASAKTDDKKSQKSKTTASSPRNMLVLVFVATLLPLSFEIAGLRLTPIRLLLLATVLPFAARVITGQIGRFSVVDKFVIFHGLWVIIALMAVHGVDRIAFAFITAVELVGGYFLGRVLIRSAADFRLMIKFLLFSLIFLFPFALVELFTGRLVIPELISPFFSTVQRGHSATGRLGLERVRVVFEHPILYGLYCSVAIANLAYYIKTSLSKKIAGIGFVVGMTFMSLSSAPLLSSALQIGLMLWGWLTKGAWKPLIILSVLGYVFLDLLSNRSPVTILIETLTFSSGTGWTRIVQFQYGIQEAISNPFFGIGMNDWKRPDWMQNLSSVDNFWLLTVMRYGFVGCGLLILSFLIHIYSISKVENLNEDAQRYRVGYLITLVGVCFSLVTVHIWGSAVVFIMFYVGAGAWFYTSNTDIDETDAPETDDTPAARRAIKIARRTLAKQKRNKKPGMKS